MKCTHLSGMLFLLATLPIAGCAGDTEDRAESLQVVYIDGETQTPVLADATNDLPARHPATGRRTLMPGLFCEFCEEWHRAPPLEVLQRSPAARQCPTCGATMASTGPHRSTRDE